VIFDNLAATVTASQSTPARDDQLTVTIPSMTVTAPTSVTVQAFNARGVASNTVPFTITP
jgi:hypothetical protein